MHEHYDEHLDRRWACVAMPCLTPEVAPVPTIADVQAMLEHAEGELRWKRPPMLAVKPDFLDDLALFRRTLESIAKNTCCAGCGEAARVAKAALDTAGGA